MDSNQPTPPLSSAVSQLLRTVLGAFAKVTAVVAIVLGVSVAIAMPTCGCTTKASAYRAAMKSDLRNFMTAEETYFADSLSYTTSLSALSEAYSMYGSGFYQSSGVTLVIEAATDAGYSARTSHSGTPVQCVVFMGDVESPDPGQESGEIYCSEP